MVAIERPHIPDQQQTGLRKFAQAVLPGLALWLAYTALACFGLQWATIAGAASPVWPAAGVALAGLLLSGIRLWPAIFLGRLAAGWLAGSQQPFAVELMIAAGNTLGAIIPLLIIRRRGGLDRNLPDLTQLLRYLAASAGSALIAASLGTAAVSLSAALPLETVIRTFANWIMANFVGAILVGPLLLSWLVPAAPLSLRERIHFAIVIVVILGFCALYLQQPSEVTLRTWHVFPVLVWAALAFGLRGATLSILIVAMTAIWASEHSPGLVSGIGSSRLQKAAMVQQFIAVVALTILILAEFASERRAKNTLAEQGRMLRQAEEEARARAEELQVLLDSVPAAIWVARDPACREIIGNRTSAELLRLPHPDDNMSKSRDENPVVSHFRVLDSEGRELAPHELPVQRAARGEIIRDFEERVVFNDGSARDLLGNAMPLYGRDGQLRGSVAAFIDVTERKAARDRERLLSREVDHRAKNIMAVIQAIVQLTEAEEIGAYRKAISGRISSLARTHTLLAQNRWDGAELHDLIAEELAPYLPMGVLDGKRVKLDGPRLKLRPQTAQSIALIIHELVTNALKHGALSAPGGKVTVSWEPDAPGPKQRVTIRWEEQDGPPVSQPKEVGFGLSLIEATARDQLYGDITQIWAPEGLNTHFTVPVGDLFAPAEPEA